MTFSPLHKDVVAYPALEKKQKRHGLCYFHLHSHLAKHDGMWLPFILFQSYHRQQQQQPQTMEKRS